MNQLQGLPFLLGSELGLDLESKYCWHHKDPGVPTSCIALKLGVDPESLFFFREWLE